MHRHTNGFKYNVTNACTTWLKLLTGCYSRLCRLMCMCSTFGFRTAWMCLEVYPQQTNNTVYDPWQFINMLLSSLLFKWVQYAFVVPRSVCVYLPYMYVHRYQLKQSTFYYLYDFVSVLATKRICYAPEPNLFHYLRYKRSVNVCAP